MHYVSRYGANLKFYTYNTHITINLIFILATIIAGSELTYTTKRFVVGNTEMVGNGWQVTCQWYLENKAF